MENVVLFSFPVLFAAGVLSLLSYVFWASTRKLPIEQNKELIHGERCGGLAGAGMRFKGPFVRLAIYKDFLVLGHLQSVVLNFSEIESVESGGMWGTALCINHTRKNLGAIQLSVSNHERLKALLTHLIEQARQAQGHARDS